MKTTGIIQIRFKEGIDFEKVEETIRNIYFKNKDVLEGMEYNQFDKEETFNEINKKIKEWCKK